MLRANLRHECQLISLPFGPNAHGIIAAAGGGRMREPARRAYHSRWRCTARACDRRRMNACSKGRKKALLKYPSGGSGSR